MFLAAAVVFKLTIGNRGKERAGAYVMCQRVGTDAALADPYYFGSPGCALTWGFLH